jgi:hypothetical protein
MAETAAAHAAAIAQAIKASGIEPLSLSGRTEVIEASRIWAPS